MTVKNMKNENTNWGQSVSGVVIYEIRFCLQDILMAAVWVN